MRGRRGPGFQGTRPAHLELPHALRTGGHGRELVLIALFLRIRPRCFKTPLVLAGASLGSSERPKMALGHRRGAGGANPGETRRVFSSPNFALGTLPQQLRVFAIGLPGLDSDFWRGRSLVGASVQRCKPRFVTQAGRADLAVQHVQNQRVFALLSQYSKLRPLASW